MAGRTHALKLYAVFERIINQTLLILLMVVVLNGTARLAIETARRLWYRALGQPLGLESMVEFLEEFMMFRSVFGAILLVLIGVELMRTVVAYLEHHELHVEVVFTVAMIAIARHAIDIDIEHANPLLLIGMGVMILALTAGYYLYRRAVWDSRSGGPSTPGPDPGS